MLPKFAIVTPTGVARAVVTGRNTAQRVCDSFTLGDMLPHTIRLATADDERLDVLRDA